jgi:hypothetical protein
MAKLRSEQYGTGLGQFNYQTCFWESDPNTTGDWQTRRLLRSEMLRGWLVPLQQPSPLSSLDHAIEWCNAREVHDSMRNVLYCSDTVLNPA